MSEQKRETSVAVAELASARKLTVVAQGLNRLNAQRFLLMDQTVATKQRAESQKQTSK